MGRKVRRVPLDFDWPLNERWAGFVNPFYSAVECGACKGSGYSPEAMRLKDRWYGYIRCNPSDYGSTPFSPDHPTIRALAVRNCEGATVTAVNREAARLASHFNGGWMHHLAQVDVDALVAADRLRDFTHERTSGSGWATRSPVPNITAADVNTAYLSGIGHDSINAHICIDAACKRRGVSPTCDSCDGDGSVWPSTAARDLCERWTDVPPPAGDAYQIWETVSEGSPISPPFATPEELAEHMSHTKWGADSGTSYAAWLLFITGPGWAPSMVMADGVLMSGVQASTE